MMNVRDGKTKVRRETDDTHRGRPIIVALSSEGLHLREKGRRTVYVLPYRVAFDKAARLHADDRVAKRRPKRKRTRSAKLSTRGR